MLRRLAAIAVFASVAFTTAPALLRLAREARGPHDTSFADATRAIVASVPPNERLTLVARTPAENDLAVFFNYYAYPHPTRVVALRDAAQLRRVVGFIDGKPRLTSYASLLTPIVRTPQLPAAARRAFLVPFVCSTTGTPPNVYTVEALLAADAPARATLTLHRTGGAPVTQTLDLRHPRHFTDLFAELAAASGFGWLQVESDAPVRAAFWLVNRGTGAANAIDVIDRLPAMPLRFPPRPDARLWLLNPSDTEVPAMAGGVAARLRPHEIIPMGPETIVHADEPLIGFLTEKLPDGGTRFTWPEPPQ